MSGKIEARLNELGLTLPPSPAPVATYVPTVQTGNLVFVSGQVSRNPDNSPIIGKLGDDMTTEEGYAAARTCGLQLLAQLRDACGGDLDRVVRVVKLLGFVNATPDFADHPKVINGTSDLMVEVFGDAGRHARSAVGMGSLPLGTAIEVEAIFEIAG